MAAYHHGNLRETLIHTGIQYICEEGMGALSLRKISEKCGVSHAAAYSHFADKDALLNAMRDYVTAQFIEASAQGVRQCKNEREKFTRLGRNYVVFFAENPYYYLFLFQRTDIVVDLNNLENTENYPLFETFKTAALSVLQTLNLPSETHLQNLLAMWGIVHGLAGIAAMGAVQYQGDWGAHVYQSKDFY